MVFAPRPSMILVSVHVRCVSSPCFSWPPCGPFSLCLPVVPCSLPWLLSRWFRRGACVSAVRLPRLRVSRVVVPVSASPTGSCACVPCLNLDYRA